MKEEDDIQFIILKSQQLEQKKEINQYDQYYENPLHFSIIDLDKNNILQQKDVYIDMEQQNNSQKIRQNKENSLLNIDQKGEQNLQENFIEQQAIGNENQVQESQSIEIKKQNEDQVESSLDCSVMAAFKKQLQQLHPSLCELLENQNGVHKNRCLGECSGQKLKPIHLNSCCSLCQKSPIVGGLFKCTVLKDFSLCEQCEQNSDHPYDLIKVNKQSLLVNQQPLQQNFQTEYTRRFLVSDLPANNPLSESQTHQFSSNSNHSQSQDNQNRRFQQMQNSTENHIPCNYLIYNYLQIEQPNKRFETSNDIELKIQEQLQKKSEKKLKKAILKQKIYDIFNLKVSNSKKLKELNKDLDCQIIINMIINDNSILEKLK